MFCGTLGEQHPSVAETAQNLAKVCLARREYDRAEEAIRAALEIYRDSLPPGNLRFAAAEGLFGSSPVGQGRNEE